MQWPNAVLVAGTLLLTSAAGAAPPNGAMLSLACNGCHGTLGVSAGPSVPSLAGQSREYFAAAMKRFRSGERPSTIMGRLAKAYSDADIEAMAAFYARLRPVAQDGRANPMLAEKGRAVYYKQCRFCHLDRGPLWQQVHRYREHDRQCRHCHADYGSDTKDDTPVIAGQWFEYLKMQLEEFRNGTRPMSRGKAEKLKALSQDDLEAVAHFYAGQTAE